MAVEKEMREMENSIILEEILEELTENAKHISSSSLEKFADEIIKARHIFVAGAGRSGFVARGFANRLMHLGLEVFFVGEPTTPAIEVKDLLIISSGSGETDSLVVMANKAREAGASVVTVRFIRKRLLVRCVKAVSLYQGLRRKVILKIQVILFNQWEMRSNK